MVILYYGYILMCITIAGGIYTVNKFLKKWAKGYNEMGVLLCNGEGKAEIYIGGNGNGEQDFVNGCLHN